MDPWTVSEADFPAGAPLEERLAFLLNWAVLAPSSHNSQPWLFRIHGSEIELFADRRRALPVVDPDDRELVISCGAALQQLRVALEHFGFRSWIELVPERTETQLLARIHCGEQVAPPFAEDPLFDAILARRTFRFAFEPRPVPETILAQLGEAAALEGAWLEPLRSEESRHALVSLVTAGDRIQAASRAFRHELAHWIHPNRSHTDDGMPGYAHGLGDLGSQAGPFVIRTFHWGKGQAAKDRQLAEGSPVLAVLGTAGDDLRCWLAAGQALARVLLMARREGLFASYLNQPIEVPELRPRLRELAGGGGAPQLVLRLGYGTEVRPTPRRPVSEVLVGSHAGHAHP